MAKVNDPRIGILDAEGKVIQYPSKYANGQFWNRAGNPTPTTTYFGKDGRYFYVLPVLVATISPELRAEFERLVSDPVAAPSTVDAVEESSKPSKKSSGI